VVQVLVGLVAGCASITGVLLVVQAARPALRRHHELVERTEHAQPHRQQTTSRPGSEAADGGPPHWVPDDTGRP
jgi:hypothetical protein